MRSRLERGVVGIGGTRLDILEGVTNESAKKPCTMCAEWKGRNALIQPNAVENCIGMG